jgi:hypothetical protein
MQMPRRRGNEKGRAHRTGGWRGITELMHSTLRWPQSACPRVALPWLLVHVLAVMANAKVLQSTTPHSTSDFKDVPHHHHTGTSHANDQPPSLLSTRFMNAATPVLPPLYRNASAPDATVSGHATCSSPMHSIRPLSLTHHLTRMSIVVGCVGVCATERCIFASRSAMACLSQLTACTSTVQ